MSAGWASRASFTAAVPSSAACGRHMRQSMKKARAGTSQLSRGAGTPGADTRLRDDLAHLRDDTLAPELALDLLEAARKRGASLADELRAYEATLPEDDLLAPRRVALYGGDPERGQRVFESAGDCLRCHSTQVGDGGHGSRAGPNLDGVGKRERVYLLESVVDPQAEVTRSPTSPPTKIGVSEDTDVTAAYAAV